MAATPSQSHEPGAPRKARVGDTPCCYTSLQSQLKKKNGVPEKARAGDAAGKGKFLKNTGNMKQIPIFDPKEDDFKVNKRRTCRKKKEMTSSSSEEDIPDVGKDFFIGLSLLKSRDPAIYEKNFELFKDQDFNSDEDEECLQYLKGQKTEIDKESEKKLSCLKDFFENPLISEGDKFIRDYFLNKWYKVEKENTPTSEELMQVKVEQEQSEEQDWFEKKFNNRFKELDPELIKRYPRTVSDSIGQFYNQIDEKIFEQKTASGNGMNEKKTFDDQNSTFKGNDEDKSCPKKKKFKTKGNDN